MLKLTAATATLSLSLVTSALSGTLDFQTLADGVTPTNPLLGGSLADHTPYLVGSTYASLGVVFSSQGETDPEKGPIFGKLTGTTGTNTVVQDYKRDTTTGATFNIRADFLAGTSFVTVDAYGPLGSILTMSGYNSIGTLLDSVTSGSIPSLGSPAASPISLSGLGTISYVIWESSSPFSGAPAIDNLRADLAPIPLPAGALLMGTALGVMCLARRRRKA